MAYNYYETVKKDVKEYIKENKDNYLCNNIEELECKLYTDMWYEDSITGRASESYFCDRYMAQECINGNWPLLKKALENYCYESIEFLEKGEEWCDVIIRCYVLNIVLDEIIEEMRDELEECLALPF